MMAHAQSGWHLVAHEPAGEGLEKIAVLIPVARLFREVATEREGDRCGPADTAAPEGDERGGVGVGREEGGLIAFAQVAEIVAVDFGKPRGVAARDFLPASGRFRSRGFFDEGRPGYRNGLLCEDIGKFSRHFGEEDPALSPLRDVFEKGGVGVAPRAHADDAQGRTVRTHFLDQLRVVAGFLGIGRVAEEDDMALTEGGTFEDVPSGFESFVDENPAAHRLDPADAVVQLAAALSDIEKGCDLMGLAVDGEDGDGIHRAEELDGARRAFVGELHFGVSARGRRGHRARAVHHDGHGYAELAVFAFQFHRDG